MIRWLRIWVGILSAKDLGLSLQLYFLKGGIWCCCKKNSCSEIDPFWRECTSVDTEHITAAEGVLSCLMETGDTAQLLRMLSSLVIKYLQVYRKAFLATTMAIVYLLCYFSSILTLVKVSKLNMRRLVTILFLFNAFSICQNWMLWAMEEVLVFYGKCFGNLWCMGFPLVFKLLVLFSFHVFSA